MENKDTPYMKREIDEKFMDIKSSLDRIEIQTTKHNGRLSSVEKVQYLAMGGVGVLSIIVVPILTWALIVLVNIDATVHKSVDQALSAYDINNAKQVSGKDK